MTNETTASQPKSIGDDAQFRSLMNAWDASEHGADADRIYDEIATFIDSRAPAAQASATIQAAPTVSTFTLTGHQLVAALDLLAPGLPRDPEELDGDLTFGVVQHKDDDGTVATGMCCWNDDTDGVLPLDEHPDDAATIQEPVMVAEPVGEVQANAADLEVRQQVTEALGLGRASNASFTWSYLLGCIKDAVELAASTAPAAQMVADPAGVAVGYITKEAAAVLSRKESYATDICIERTEIYSEPLFAATVKAVPSEAMREVGSVTLAKWGDEEWEVAWRGEISKLMDGLYYTQYKVGDTVKLYAAPLADKTGGGE